MRFQATELEFRIRFWIIAAIFALGFYAYGIDHVNASEALSRLALGGHPDENSAIFGRWITGFFALGTAIVAIGAFIRTWAGSYLHSSIIHDSALHGEQLVADGPYRHVRNPLYLGNVFFAIGIGFLASRIGLVVISIGMLVFVWRLIGREETTLLQSQGESYRRYFAAVPRLIPSLAARVPASGARADWADGFTGEMFMWAGAAAMLVLTITRSIVYFWIVLGAGFAIYFLQSWLRSRKKISRAA